MTRRIEFNSTYELYGVDPKELKDLTYEEALEKKLEGGKKKLKEIFEKIKETSEQLVLGNIDKSLAQEQSNLNYNYEKIKKAVTLVEILLDELRH